MALKKLCAERVSGVQVPVWRALSRGGKEVRLGLPRVIEPVGLADMFVRKKRDRIVDASAPSWLSGPGEPGGSLNSIPLRSIP